MVWKHSTSVMRCYHHSSNISGNIGWPWIGEITDRYVRLPTFKVANMYVVSLVPSQKLTATIGFILHSKHSMSSFSAMESQFSSFLYDSKHSNLIITIWTFLCDLTKNLKSWIELKSFTHISHGIHPLCIRGRQNRRAKFDQSQAGMQNMWHWSDQASNLCLFIILETMHYSLIWIDGVKFEVAKDYGKCENHEYL